MILASPLRQMTCSVKMPTMRAYSSPDRVLLKVLWLRRLYTSPLLTSLTWIGAQAQVQVDMDLYGTMMVHMERKVLHCFPGEEYGKYILVRSMNV